MPRQCSCASVFRATGFRPASCNPDGRPGGCRPSISARSGPSTPTCRFAPVSPSGPNCRSAWPRSAIALGDDDEPKIRGALHSRIPMVTPDEQRAVQAENFKDDEHFWDTMRDLNASHIDGHKAQIALAEAKVAEDQVGSGQSGREG